MLRLLLIASLSFASVSSFADNASAADGACISWLDQRIGKLNSSAEHGLYTLTAGKTVLTVNTASFCGFIPQFKGLEALYQHYDNVTPDSASFINAVEQQL